MKKLILVLAMVVGSQAQAVSQWDYNVQKDLLKVTCYVGGGVYAQETIVGQRASARSHLKLDAAWKDRNKTAVQKTFQVELVTINGHGPGKQVVIQGVQDGNVFDLSYYPNIGGRANLAVDNEIINYTSNGGLTCIGIFREGSVD
jgi:hypothetical protein